MTKQSNDLSATPFSNWTRQRDELPSNKAPDCYHNTNIDYMWSRWKSRIGPEQEWMFIEEKRYSGRCTGKQPCWYPQKGAFEQLFRYCCGLEATGNQDVDHKTQFKGFFILEFEKELPENNGHYALEYRKHCEHAYQRWCKNNGKTANKPEFIAFCRLSDCEPTNESIKSRFDKMEGKLKIRELLESGTDEAIPVTNEQLIKFLQFDDSWSNGAEPPAGVQSLVDIKEEIITGRYN